MITKETLEEIVRLAVQAPLDHSITSVLRGSFPDIHFSYCLDDDVISSRPVVSTPEFNLYLVDARDHCLALTTDSEIATGVLVAELTPDE